MNGFKRFLLFLFSLAGLVCLVILGMPWFGYGGRGLSELIYNDAFWIVLEVTLAMTVCFLVFNMGRALFGRKRVDTISVMSINGGEISVTKTAVASQAGHIIEALGVGKAKDVVINSNKKGGTVDVDIKVLPYESIDVTAEAPIVHDALVTGLGAMCGEKLGNVSVEFLEPEHGSSLVEFDDDETEVADKDTVLAASATGASEVSQGESSADATGDITIPMHTEKSE